jgi:hypothetical protein
MRDRDPSRELGQPADVVLMVVRADEVIDPLHARGGEHRHDAISVARAGVAGVDQDGLAGGRDEERGFAALRVGDVDIERGRTRSGGLGVSGAWADEAGQRQGEGDQERVARAHGGVAT